MVLEDDRRCEMREFLHREAIAEIPDKKGVLGDEVMLLKKKGECSRVVRSFNMR